MIVKCLKSVLEGTISSGFEKNFSLGDSILIGPPMRIFFTIKCNLHKGQILNPKKSNNRYDYWQGSSICPMVDTLSICSGWYGNDYCSTIKLYCLGNLDSNLWSWNSVSWKSVSDCYRMWYRNYIYWAVSSFCESWRRKPVKLLWTIKIGRY